ncbi:uncharacterized protein BDZ83DRAFT_648377 [Colletotrichum acutatum]|uniref:Uncharacterized protein n=1 Tax=Glomerella acutata TaxID=27357 RepID=A0AAD8UVS8_GLOAC|nr:uncharacterized protein BDZ83DRAFT_648377 [Colletotrichum acutatum]KAK1728708.1 hypothetical protein BDZ83DRAFT_648377 [Colletotrichum acutatum]
MNRTSVVSVLAFGMRCSREMKREGEAAAFGAILLDTRWGVAAVYLVLYLMVPRSSDYWWLWRNVRYTGYLISSKHGASLFSNAFYSPPKWPSSGLLVNVTVPTEGELGHKSLVRSCVRPYNSGSDNATCHPD